jgi:iron(II)-dependent oxidoreductase
MREMKLGIASSIAALFVFSTQSIFGGILNLDTEKDVAYGTKIKKKKGQTSIKWVHSEQAGISFTKTEITVAQYRYCVEEGKCTMPKSNSDDMFCSWGHSYRDNHPINCVDWSQASDFCSWAGGRLPTEQEWEAEASNKWSRKFPWGNKKVTCYYAVWGDRKRIDGCGRNSTWPVCSKPAGNSVSGLCDMSGNVWEWTSSLYEEDSFVRVVRGGSWGSGNPEVLRASYREGRDVTRRTSHYGFRCVQE